MEVWGAFVFFVAWCIIAFVYTVFCVPETRGLSLDEMDAVFEQPLYRMRKPVRSRTNDEEYLATEKGQIVMEERAASGHVENK
jgi:hypothetical protein